MTFTSLAQEVVKEIKKGKTTPKANRKNYFIKNRIIDFGFEKIVKITPLVKFDMQDYIGRPKNEQG
jgi:hypothetical protein